MCLQFVVYASLILDTLPFHASKDFNRIDVPDKAIKQSRDLKYVFVFANLHTKSRYCTAQLLAQVKLARARDMKG